MNYQENVLAGFASIRKEVREREGITSLSPGYRGYKVGDTSECIQGAATALGIGYDGTFRAARLALASEVFQRDIGSYNDLSDAELDALHNWVRGSGLELAHWLRTKYGHQMNLFEAQTD